MMQQLKMIEEVLKWRALLDISLITMGLFFIYRTFRTLGTWKIVVGLLTAVGLALVASILDLEGTEWIFSNLSSVAVIGFIILFQPEIRKFFEKAVSLKGNPVGKEGPQMSSLLSEALFEMANLRYGAIVVIPGKESVKAWTSEGINLNAEPSVPLIISLFDPNSPGHDGALIFERGKLTSFGIHLPLSTSNTLTNQYGTRHHAALGLSEVTDSLIFVVSEERGTITLFKKGYVIPIKNKGELASHIVSHWKSTTSYPFPKKGQIKKRILFAEVAISLLSALLFYYHVVVIKSETRVKSFTVPIEYTLKQKNLALSQESSKIEIRLSGRASDLDRIDTSQLRVRIDLSNALPGQQTIAVTEDDLSLPKRVHLVSTEPSTLDVTLRAIKEMEVNVSPQLVGTLPEGYEIISMQVIPEKIKIRAPAEDGDSKEQISLITTPIFLQSIREKSNIRCQIIAPSKIKPVNGQWPDVEVKLDVKRIKQEDISSGADTYNNRTAPK